MNAKRECIILAERENHSAQRSTSCLSQKRSKQSVSSNSRMTSTSKLRSSAFKAVKEKNPTPQIYNKHFITPLRGAVYEMAPVDIETHHNTTKNSAFAL